MNSTNTSLLQVEPNPQKAYGGLRTGDELDVYCGGRALKRCQVVKVRREGDRIHLLLKPVIFSKPFTATFLATATTAVYSTPYTVERALAIAPQVLEILPLEQPSWTIQGIRLAYRERFNKSPAALPLACNLLAEKGQLIQRERGKTVAYRKPLPCKIGLPVVELPHTRSERLGWIAGFQIMRSGQSAFVIRWLDGSQSFSPEERLEPLTKENRAALKAVQIAQAFARGEAPEGFIEIPDYLISNLAQELKSRQVQGETLLAIAQALGWNVEPYESEPWRLRHPVLDWLDLYHPQWRLGIVQSISIQQEGVA